MELGGRSPTNGGDANAWMLLREDANAWMLLSEDAWGWLGEL